MAAQAIIARQPEGEPDDFVFAPARGDGALALSKAWRKVREEANLPPTLGLHGLRHSVASHLAMGGAQASRDHDGDGTSSTFDGATLHPFCRNLTSGTRRARRLGGSCSTRHRDEEIVSGVTGKQGK